MPIALECRLLVETLFLDVPNVVDPNLPLNKVQRPTFNAVFQFTPALIQTFIHPGYKSIIIVPIPINGLVTLKLNLSTPLEPLIRLFLLTTLVQCLQQTICPDFKAYAT